MSGYIAKKAAEKVLGRYSGKKANRKSPYKENGKKRPLPAEIQDKNDKKILMSYRKWAHRLDMGFNICGIRVGWSAIIGLVPAIGDAIDCFIAFLLVQKAKKINGGLESDIVQRMYFNIAADFGIGLFPVLGDFADVWFKANSRNAWLLEKYMIQRAREQAELAEGGGGGEARPPAGREGAEEAAPPPPKSSGLFGGWLGSGGGKKSRRPDEEMAMAQVHPQAHPSSHQANPAQMNPVQPARTYQQGRNGNNNGGNGTGSGNGGGRR